MIINKQKIVFFTDPHQDCWWVERILKKEKYADYWICGGDLFDSFKDYPDVYDIRATAKYFMGLKKGLGEKLIMLVGNHDLGPYYAYYSYASGKLPKFQPYYCSGYTSYKAQEIAKEISHEFIVTQKLSVMANGWLISHAGVLPHLIPVAPTQKESLNKFFEECERVWANFREEYKHPFFRAGLSRGGRFGAAGLTWCDWDCDFVDGLPWPQLVGHTTQQGPPRRNKSSWCCDQLQSWYCVIEPDKLIFKNMLDNEEIIHKV